MSIAVSLRLGWLVAALALALAPTAARADNPRAAKLVEEAKQAESKGDLPKAIIHLKNAVRADPDNPALREQLGLLELRTGDVASAEKELALVIERAPDRPQALLGLGEALLRQRKFSEVLQQIAPGKRGDDAEAQVLAIRGAALAGLKRPDEAVAALRQGVALKSTVRGQIALARGLVLANDMAGAEQAADAALALAPEQPEAMLLKADLRLSQGDRAAAAAMLDRLVNLNDKLPEAHLRRAVVRIELNDLAGAEADLDAVAAIVPKAPIAIYYRALIVLRKGDAPGAQQLIDQLPTDFVASDWRYSLLAATIGFANRRFEAAEALARKAQTDAPDEIAPRRLLAIMRLRAGQPAQAIELLAPALAKAPDDLSLIKLMAEADLAAGKTSEGIDLLQKAAAKHPDDPQLVRGLAAGEARAGHPEEALGNLESFAQRDPAERSTFIMLLSSYLRSGEFDKARETVARFRAALKDSPLPDYYAGVVAVAERKFDEARASFDAAIARDPKFIGARLALAQLERQANRPDAEQAAYEAVLKVDPASEPAMMGLADLERAREHPAEAERWLERAATANPQAIEPRIALINMQIAAGATRRAVETGEAARKALPENRDIADALGRAYLANKQVEQAIGIYRALASQAPPSAMVQLRLADALAQAGDTAATGQALERAAEIAPDAPEPVRALMGFELVNKRPERAREHVEAFRSRHPDAPAANILIGDYHMSQREFAKAAQAYAAAVAKTNDPTHAALQISALIRADDLAAARALADQWTTKTPGSAVVPEVLASHYLVTHADAQALALYEAILRVQPNDAVALNNLAWLERTSNPKRALQRAERAWELVPGSADIADTLGVILLAQGQAGRAVELLRKAAAPGGPQSRLHLAQALYAADQPAEARKILEDLAKQPAAFDGKEDAARLLAVLRTK